MKSQRPPFKHLRRADGSYVGGSIPWPDDQKQIVRDMLPEYTDGNGRVNRRGLTVAYNQIAKQNGFSLRAYGTIFGMVKREKRKRESV